MFEMASMTPDDEAYKWNELTLKEYAKGNPFLFLKAITKCLDAHKNFCVRVRAQWECRLTEVYEQLRQR